MTRPPSSRLMRSMPVRSGLAGWAGALSYCASADRSSGGPGSSGGGAGICTAAGALALSSSGPPCGLRGAPGVLPSCAADMALIRRLTPSTDVNAVISSRSQPLLVNPLASPSRANRTVSAPPSTECTVALLSSIQATRRWPLTASRISGQRCRTLSTSEDARPAEWAVGGAGAVGAGEACAEPPGSGAPPREEAGPGDEPAGADAGAAADAGTGADAAGRGREGAGPPGGWAAGVLVFAAAGAGGAG